MIPIVSEESLARYTDTQTQTKTKICKVAYNFANKKSKKEEKQGDLKVRKSLSVTLHSHKLPAVIGALFTFSHLSQNVT